MALFQAISAAFLWDSGKASDRKRLCVKSHNRHMGLLHCHIFSASEQTMFRLRWSWSLSPALKQCIPHRALRCPQSLSVNVSFSYDIFPFSGVPDSFVPCSRGLIIACLRHKFIYFIVISHAVNLSRNPVFRSIPVQSSGAASLRIICPKRKNLPRPEM